MQCSKMLKLPPFVTHHQFYYKPIFDHLRALFVKNERYNSPLYVIIPSQSTEVVGAFDVINPPQNHIQKW